MMRDKFNTKNKSEFIISQAANAILGLQSISRDAAENVSHLGRLDLIMELITYSFVLYLQHGRHGVISKLSICLASMKDTKIKDTTNTSFSLYSLWRPNDKEIAVSLANGG